MGSTGESDRKRRHFSSISPMTGAAPKKHFLAPSADDKKLDVSVLQYQNQKLFQQLEAQKIEYFVLDDKYNKLNEQHKAYEDAVAVVNKSWEQMVTDLELHSIWTNESSDSHDYLQNSSMPNNLITSLADGASLPIQDDFLSRLLETGTIESCSSNERLDPGGCLQRTSKLTKAVLKNTICSINSMWHANEDIFCALQVTNLEDDVGLTVQKSVNNLWVEIKSLIMEMNDIHLTHRLLASQLQNHRDMDAKLKTERRRLSGALASTAKELEDCNSKLGVLRSQGDGSKGAPVIFPYLGHKLANGDGNIDTQNEIHEMESSLKELKDLNSSRMLEINNLHERRIEVLNKVGKLQNAMVDMKNITCSRTFVALKGQLDKSRAEMDHCRISFEKLQVEKENCFWREKEVAMKGDLADVSGKISDYSESRIVELEQVSQKLIQDRDLLQTKLREALTKPGRKEFIAEFKNFVSSFPKEIGAMQNEQSKLKENASDIHSLRAQVQFLSGLLGREVRELQSMSKKSSCQISEMNRLHLVVDELKEVEQELKLILEMYRRELTDSRDIIESRDMEYKAWAQVQILKSSLDEHNLENRVKLAIEAEAASQLRLAAAETEIAEFRQKLELSIRNVSKASELLNSKHEEGEVYISEIESIGQAYEDMQTQNQQLLQQILERDECNIKLVMEGVKARQLLDGVYSDLKSLDKKLQEFNSLMGFYDQKVTRFDDQSRIRSDQAAKLIDDNRQSSISLNNVQRRLADVQREAQLLRHSLNEKEMNAMESRLNVTKILIELEKERYNKKRIDEGLETMTMKVAALRTQTDSSVLLEKLQQEIREYKGILKCHICHARQKEVVIAKCYHLFCSQCIQKTIESRHRKCPTCSISFGPNDVKPIYI